MGIVVHVTCMGEKRNEEKYIQGSGGKP